MDTTASGSLATWVGLRAEFADPNVSSNTNKRYNEKFFHPDPSPAFADTTYEASMPRHFESQAHGIRDMSSINRQLIDPANVFVENGQTERLGKIPAWWSSFMFHVLNGRQLSVYLYLVMLMGDSQMCHPTTQEIAHDLGLASSTMVFEAIGVLEVRGFILRARRLVPQLGSRRNVYQRPSCEYTILALLRCKHIDGSLRPLPYLQRGRPAEGEALRRQGLLSLLGDEYARYNETAESAKTDFLRGALASRFSR